PCRGGGEVCRRQATERAWVLEVPGRGGESALERVATDRGREGGSPRPAVLRPQLLFALLQLHVPGPIVMLASPCQLALHANELRRPGRTVLLEPVGVDRPRGVVVWRFPDRSQESLLVGHHGTQFRFQVIEALIVWTVQDSATDCNRRPASHRPRAR